MEVVNKCLETYLRCFVSEIQNQWAQWLPLVEWWYNTLYHIATCMTPFETIYGKKPPLVLSYFLGVSKIQAVDQMLIVREAILHTLKENLVMAQNCMKQQADQGRFERQFVEGDRCFIEYNLIRKIPSRLPIVRNWRPNFMVLIPFSSGWDRWYIS